MVTRTATVFILTTVYLTTSVPLHDQYLPNLHAINNLNNLEGRDLPEFDMNLTIQEVENIIKKDSSLPRLTRGEIVDIIENITASDRKQRKAKAVMLVMPYTANNSDGAGMHELFTKAPVTRLIGAEAFVVKPTTPRRKVSSKHSSNYKITSPTSTSTTTTTTTTTSTTTEVTTLPVFSEPQPSSTTVTPSKRRRRPTPQRFFNHKYPEDRDHYQQNEGLRIVNPPKLQTRFQPQAFVTVPITNDPVSDSIPQASYRPKAPAVSAAPFSFTQHPNTLETRLSKLPELPDEIKAALNNLNLQNYNMESISERDDSIANEEFEIPLEPLDGAFKPQAITTTPRVPDISNVADTLTPEMKELLMTFGLLENPNSKPTAFTEPQLENEAASANITRDSFLKFKPLPESTPVHGEMEEFLGRFGLGRQTTHQKKRTQKSIEGVPDLPESMKNILMDMNLVVKKAPDSKINNNVFRPTQNPTTTEQELEKLNQLLDVIKQLEKLNSTSDKELNKTIDLNRINDLVNSLNHQQLAPINEQSSQINPLNYDFGLSKNEVKRQESSTSTTPSSSTSTEDSKMPDMKDLEASFGGTEAAAEETETIPPPTEAPKTGFYYLLDWNSFFDIDDQKGKRVNLRFQPKAGDPKRFLSVSVP